MHARHVAPITTLRIATRQLRPWSYRPSPRPALQNTGARKSCFNGALRLWVGAWCCWASGAVTPAADQTTGPAVWQPRAKTVTVAPLETAGPEGRDIAGVRIRGRMEQGWNYAHTSPLPMTAGKLYRLSAWLRVDRLGSDSPGPYFKCEFTPAERNRTLGQVHTERYDQARLGTWQHLVGEFQSPDGTQNAWLALEKGTNEPSEIDACLADVQLEIIPRFGFYDTYRLRPVPAPLAKLRGVHPRIYLTKERIADLRQTIPTTHAAAWKKVREQADQAVRRGPPSYVLDDGHSGDEQLWQREVGNTLPLLALAYVLTGQDQYLASARQWALAACGYKTWGLGRLDGLDLAAGHQLFGLSLVYDWCYDSLDEAARQQIRETLVRRTTAMFEAAATRKASWHQSYLQNHLWVNIAGMAAAGFALFDEVDEASCWIGLPLDKFRRTMAALGPDGASHEGVGYWEYGVEYLLKFMDLARTHLDVDLYDHPWWRHTATYAQYLSLPRHAWTRGNCIVDLADCPRGHWYGPDYLLRGLAGQYQDGYAQWLAEQIDQANVAAPAAAWLNLLWWDASLPPKSPDSRPTLQHFADMGIVSARSDWAGDEALLVFKCGPFIGHEAVKKFAYDPGGGHVHPDANHFVLFGGGQWLIRDDGYHPKWTGQHNSLLIGGRGQFGEGQEWFAGSRALHQKGQPHVLQALSTPALDQITGDATHAYPQVLGLQRFVRHLLFVKPDLLIVADDILVDRPSPLELRFHPEQPAEPDGQAFVARGPNTVLRFESLTPEGLQIEAQPLPLPGRHGGAGTELFTIRLSTQRTEWRNAVALSWSPAGRQPARVALHSAPQRWDFRSGDRTLSWDWNTGQGTLVSGRSKE